MRVLHIHNVAGVSSLLAKFMDKRFGSESLVVTRRALDRYGLTDPGVVWDCGPTEFTVRCIVKARRFDIVHVHDFDKIVRYLKFFYPGKPVVLEYHSYRFTDKWADRRKFWTKADHVFVSTPNLLANAPKNVGLLSNPVETALFVKTGGEQAGTAVYIIKHPKDEEMVELARRRSAQLGLTLKEYDVRVQVIPHDEMPQLLGRYEYFIDQQYYAALSKTALEALARGSKVVRWDGRVEERLPPEHVPENVAASLYSIYGELVDPRGAERREAPPKLNPE